MQYRRKAREVALQILYTLDVLKSDVGEAESLYWGHLATPEEIFEPFWDYFDIREDTKNHLVKDIQTSADTKSFSHQLIAGAWLNKSQIDELIGGCSEHWSISRMSKVDRSILRMAVYELLHCDDIPPKVTLNEAIDLGKIYGAENSGAFINGILDALYVNLHKSGNNPEKFSMEDRKSHG